MKWFVWLLLVLLGLTIALAVAVYWWLAYKSRWMP
jgi:hypothetical protein